MLAKAENSEDTLAKLLKRNYEMYGNTKVAVRVKEHGIWKEHTWHNYYEQVKYLSLGLINLGFEHGDRISIIGENKPQWFWAQLAAQAVGGLCGCARDPVPAKEPGRPACP